MCHKRGPSYNSTTMQPRKLLAFWALDKSGKNYSSSGHSLYIVDHNCSKESILFFKNISFHLLGFVSNTDRDS